MQYEEIYLFVFTSIPLGFLLGLFPLMLGLGFAGLVKIFKLAN